MLQVRGDRPLPTSNNPAVFVLREAGEAANLIEFEKYIIIPKDGTPVPVNLQNGKTGVPNIDSIQVRSWVAKCTGEFDFQAPEIGYQPSVTIDMPINAGPQWRGNLRKQYFVKLASQRYARIDLEFIAGGRNRLVVRSHYNPAGSRNLESDPNAEIERLNHP
jgi:hypothetical protein